MTTTRTYFLLPSIMHYFEANITPSNRYNNIFCKEEIDFCEFCKDEWRSI